MSRCHKLAKLFQPAQPKLSVVLIPWTKNCFCRLPNSALKMHPCNVCRNFRHCKDSHNSDGFLRPNVKKINYSQEFQLTTTIPIMLQMEIVRRKSPFPLIRNNFVDIIQTLLVENLLKMLLSDLSWNIFHPTLQLEKLN